ncbi:DNA-directed RNA polymerase sigma-70 factor [Haloferula helveola]|uniref:DNA-directed RNA polymerase sigma-70 factor n=1 Tax=Haloferula helveola TaxID=490095 RepID=A0ABN6H127_9BACT|nr:DNA-directed RNA polymerase sigma-70 factor [Haloferula helveola]
MKSNQTRFVEALTECQEALRGYCYAQLSSWPDAEEVVQATNVKLWEKEADWDRARPFLPWALGVARITILSHFRDRQRDRLVFDEDVMTIMERHLLAAAEETPDRVQALRHCMGKMADEPREILKAHYVEGWNLAAIAESVNRSVSGIKSLLFRLRRELAGCINRELRT